MFQPYAVNFGVLKKRTFSLRCTAVSKEVIPLVAAIFYSVKAIINSL